MDKKEKIKKEEKLIVEISIILIILGLLINHYVNFGQTQGYATDFYNNFAYYFINFFARFTIFSILFSIAMIIIVIIYIFRENAVRQRIMDKIIFTQEIEENPSEVGAIKNPKWKLVLDHVSSADENKWKLAILEADIILDELLTSLSLPGQTIAEKLKAVEASDFTHIEQAWEAHKIRNAISHEGSDFSLTERETKRVIELYKQVFEEFDII